MDKKGGEEDESEGKSGLQESTGSQLPSWAFEILCECRS